jgi:GNAT superfamily N-acetyltransferase
MSPRWSATCGFPSRSDGNGAKAQPPAGARRLEIHCRPAEREPAAAVPGITVRSLSAGDADAYRALKPDPEISENEFLRRLGAGDRCIGAWRGKRLVGSRWLALDEGRVSYLGVSFALAPDACFFYEAFTAPGERRRGIGNLLDAAARAEALSIGRRKVLSGLLPENRVGAEFLRAWSKRLGVVVSIRLGPWRLVRSSVTPGYIGRPRPLPRRPAQ